MSIQIEGCWGQWHSGIAVVNAQEFYSQLQSSTRVTFVRTDELHRNPIYFSGRYDHTESHFKYRLTNDERRNLLKKLRTHLKIYR